MPEDVSRYKAVVGMGLERRSREVVVYRADWHKF
jgi:hypothetical protein